ncbi:DUF2029 domain-containing protein [Micromonospora sp. NBC_01699]|uniref:glycosyltransferase family 87 protein n=1 Tax=Micromonospora sp. NBC_01699 TaxID=2975984 RepID=UPI002E324490|nr:glycosyltransferase family 87 protein [Micromonospora sp. NBC_01699]
MDGAAGGLAGDLWFYGASTVFAAVTAATSTLLPHRAWGTVATAGYLLAVLAATGQFLARRRGVTRLTGTAARATLTAVTWATTALLPMVWQSVERAGGHADRAQEEVAVIEHAGIRLLDHGTPYLGPDAIRALPAGEQLSGYTPYQPGMALFGLPRAIAADAWWTDARIWFALVTAVALGVAVTTLRRTGKALARTAARPDRSDRADARDHALVRAVQFATVLPVCALTLATGGDDLPVLALCLLALALGAKHRFGAAGVAIGLAGALKLFAWPVALVLIGYAATRGWRTAARLAAGAIGLPVAALIPVQLVDSSALVENVLRFPLGHGVVTSPAQSPFPGYLIAAALPAGRVIAAALLVGAGLLIAVRLVRRPPQTAGSATLICGYGLLAAIVLMPSTRFGYLLYPIVFLTWAPALWLGRPAADPATDRTPPAAATAR